MSNSSYHLASLAHYRECVAIEIEEDEVGRQPRVCEFPDVYVASACLEKALRRGDAHFACDSAFYLLHHDEARLWRRLAVCAFEDFCLADLGLTARVVVAAGSRNLRLALGPERVLVHLIRRLCGATKDRRLDEIYALGAAVFLDRARLEPIADGTLGSILAPLVHETARFIAQCERPIPRRSFRSVSTEASERMLVGLARHGRVGDGLFELCLAGVKVSRCLLPLLLPLGVEATEAAGGLGRACPVAIVPAPLLEGVPAYAVDGFTRTGRAALEELVRSEARIARLFEQVPARERLDALHHLLFYAEGGRITPEPSDLLYETAKAHAMAIGMRLSPQEVGPALVLMNELLPKLHALRAARLARVLPPTTKEMDQ